jgi:RND family efflux transporter MFP subunit
MRAGRRAAGGAREVGSRQGALRPRARGLLATTWLCALGMFVTGCHEARADARTEAADEAAASARDVEVMEAAFEPRGPERRLLGTVHARRVVVAARGGGPVEEVFVALGDSVEIGQPLAQIRDGEHRDASREARAAIADARARLGSGPHAAAESPRLEAARARRDHAERELARTRSLADGHAVSARDRDRAEAELRLAEAELRATEAELRGAAASIEGLAARWSSAERSRQDALVRAPFDGSVVRRSVEVGQLVAPGTPLFEVVENGPRRVRFELPEDLARVVSVGDRVVVREPGSASAGEAATIVALAGALDEVRHGRLAEAELPSATRLLAGASAEVVVRLAPIDLVRVPRVGLDDRGGARRLFVVGEDGRVRERLVAVVIVDGEAAWVERGVVAGERVVLRPSALRDGDAVTVRGAPGGAS